VTRNPLKAGTMGQPAPPPAGRRGDSSRLLWRMSALLERAEIMGYAFSLSKCRLNAAEAVTRMDQF